MTPFETIQYKGCTIELHYDEDAESPREDENVGEILHTSWRYNLGDRRTDSEEIRSIIENPNNLYLPVYAYIHSGIRLNVTGFPCPWDSGQCGIIWCTKKKAVEEWGKSRFTKTVQNKALKYLEGEIENFNTYLSGWIAGYIAKDEAGEELASCWGFYPDEHLNYPDAIAEAKASIDRYVETRAQQREQHLALT